MREKGWFYSKFIDSNVPLEKRILSLYLYFSILSGTVAVITTYLVGLDLRSVMYICAAVFIGIGCLILSEVFNKTKTAGFIVMLDMLFIFPVLFFISGGLKSGMPVWMLIMTVSPCILMTGAMRVVMTIISEIVCVSVFMYSVYHPELVIPMETEMQLGLDISETVVFVGIIISALFRFQISSLEKKNKEIEKTNIELKNANQAKSAFLSNMSHDIRTPMNAIIGFTEIAKKDINDRQSVEHCLEKISISGEYLLTLINDVLDMSKIEQGRQTIEMSKINIGKLILDVKEILFVQMQNKNIQFKLNATNVKHYWIESDLLKLRKIIINLVSNAIKYSKPDGGNIYVSLKENPIDEQFADYQISIRDEGKGISEEFINKIFEPFEREKNTTTSGVIGTGLGLAITKSSVETLGGKISVKSKLNFGTEFIVELKCKYYTDSVKEEKEDDGNISFDGKKALLVEDNELNIELASRILSDIGFTVERAENGRQAVDIICEKPEDYFDLIYMDVLMPVLDGYEATKEIRLLPSEKRSSVPIIAMTANAFDEDVKKSFEVGMNGHIAKPISVEDIVKETKRVLTLS